MSFTEIANGELFRQIYLLPFVADGKESFAATETFGLPPVEGVNRRDGGRDIDPPQIFRYAGDSIDGLNCHLPILVSIKGTIYDSALRCDASEIYFFYAPMAASIPVLELNYLMKSPDFAYPRSDESDTCESKELTIEEAGAGEEELHGEVRAYKWSSWGRLDTGDCEYRKTKITVWDDGEYLVDAEGHCHARGGFPFYGRCRFQFTLKLKDTNKVEKWRIGRQIPGPGSWVSGGSDWETRPTGQDDALRQVFDSIDPWKSTMSRGCRWRH